MPDPFSITQPIIPVNVSVSRRCQCHDVSLPEGKKAEECPFTGWVHSRGYCGPDRRLSFRKPAKSSV
jgi:hypothetical protein